MATFITFKPDDAEEQSEDEPVLKYKLLTSKAYPPTMRNFRINWI